MEDRKPEGTLQKPQVEVWTGLRLGYHDKIDWIANRNHRTRAAQIRFYAERGVDQELQGLEAAGVNIHS